MIRSAIAIVLLLFACPPRAHADGQISARLAVGGGAGSAPEASAEALFELAIRSELLFGPATSGAVRAGPAIELRTDDFVTAEAALGGALLLPVSAAFPFVLTAGAGWASRPGGADGPFALGTIAWGLRGYNHHNPYGFGLELYVSGRFDLDDSARWQITAGIEIDLLFLVAIPSIFLWELLTEGDPDE